MDILRHSFKKIDRHWLLEIDRERLGRYGNTKTNSFKEIACR